MRSFLCIASIILLFSPGYLWAFEPTEAEVIEKLESPYLPDNNINLAESAFVFSKTIYPKVDVKTYMERVDEIASEISNRMKTKGSNDPAQIIAEINQFFKEKKIKAESVLTGIPSFLSESERDKFMLSKVLDTMSGNCLGLSTLYWSIAERMDLPLTAVIIPQHVFLRHYQGKEYRNIEATAFGAEIKDEEYVKQIKKLIGNKIQNYSTPDIISFHVLTKKQFVGLILYNRGVDNLNRNNNKLAILDFTACLKLYDSFHEAYKSRGVTYLKEGRFNEALDDLIKAARFEEDCPGTYFNLGAVYFNLKDFDEALRFLDKAIQLVPQYLDAYHHRGLVYAQRKDYDEALEDLSFVIKSSASAKAYYDRGLVYVNTKKYNEAIEDLSKALSMDNKMADAYNNRGFAYNNQKRYNEAISDFERAVALKPNNAAYYKNLGITYYKLKDLPKATEILEKYLALNPDDAEIVNLLKQIK
ncbi:MAG: tetratricopeptide repeat protein [Planctomycetes bacterium]|nr:tetratricopeptide repeat protein [Planctomycetota bacterium]